ncbi:MAG: SUMF1/EgtB/PvdO family nonheme iron enzyme [Chlamydiia bacterium]|nr:SUMF1/EgtB/PvdO family nonheme iron enzyme [Chlamydiia bacterium]
MAVKEQIGDYQILKEIGRGSLGSVYLVQHRFIKKQYVLKVLPEELAEDRGFVQRFEKEVGLLASLDHPHIVKVHDICFAEGLYFLVTDCIVDAVGETTNLLQYLSTNKERLKEKQVIYLLKQVASALDYLHQKKISHRNLKLSNILVSQGQEGIHLYLTDVALARMIGTGKVLSRSYKAVAEQLDVTIDDEGKYAPESSKQSQLHQSFVNNYAFLAPEQKVHGALESIDCKADIYSFGVLAYYLIMRVFPEGFFSLPSSVFPDLQLAWDQFFYHTLQPDPIKRASNCSQLIANLGGAKSVSGSALESMARWNAQGTTPLEKIAPAIAQTQKANTPEPAMAAPKPVLQKGRIERPTYEDDPGAIFNTENTVAPYKPEPQENIDIEPIESDMIIIHGDKFMRGSEQGTRDERPVHKVILPSFAIETHPVTNEQFVRFLEAMGGEKDRNNNDIIHLRDARIRKSGGKYHIESGYSKHPVVGVTWYGAIAYSKWVGKRLPTEAEWEIAAKGGLPEAIFPTGSNIERSQANFFSTDTTAVCSYPPNGYGLFDMAGNVYEWCQDWYDFHSYDIAQQEPENPKGPIQGVYRVLRGGCWKGLKEDMRCAHRHRNNPGSFNSTYGFRCATDVQ